jgi:hypothetical protein
LGEHDAADQQVLGAQQGPVAEKDFALLVRVTQHVALFQRRENAAVAQVAVDHVGHVLRQCTEAGPLEGHDRDAHRIRRTLRDPNGQLSLDQLAGQQQQHHDYTL